MDKKEAKEICKRALGSGALKGSEPWIMGDPSIMVTKEPTTLSMKWKGMSKGAEYRIINIKNGKKKNKKKTTSPLFQDRARSSAMRFGGGGITLDANGNFVRIAQKVKTGKDQGTVYLYTASPAFPGQEPVDDEIFRKKDEDDSDSDSSDSESDSSDDSSDSSDDESASKRKRKKKTELTPTLPSPLYVFGRIRTYDKDGRVPYVILSYCKSKNVDCETGWAWKDIYKAVKSPSVQFAVAVLDMTQDENGEVVCQAKQASAIKATPVYEIAPGVDMLAITAVCHPLEPDGKKVIDGTVNAAIEVGTLFAFS